MRRLPLFADRDRADFAIAAGVLLLLSRLFALLAALATSTQFYNLKVRAVSHVDTPWTRLASRTARGLLARKGFSYETLAAQLCAMGIQESVRGAESKVQRGSYRFAFFLQVLKAVDSEYPPSWKAYIETEDAWEIAAKKIVVHELTAHALDVAKLGHRLTRLGIPAEASSLESQIAFGEFPFVLVLQLSLVAPIGGMERFVDQRDIEHTAATVNT